MKKVFSLVAIAALAAFTLMSCEGKKDAAASGSASQEQVTDDAQAQDDAEAQGEKVKIEDQKELSCDNYTLTVPEGWQASSRMVNSSCNLRLKENPHTTASLNYTLEKAEGIAENYGKNGFKPTDDITVGDKTCKMFVKEEDGRTEYRALVAKGDGFVTFNIMPGGTPMKGDELKQVLLKNLNDIVAATALK